MDECIHLVEVYTLSSVRTHSNCRFSYREFYARMEMEKREIVRNCKLNLTNVDLSHAHLPKTNSLIFYVHFPIERPFAHQQLRRTVGTVANCFAPEILITMLDVIIGHFNPFISSQHTTASVTYSTVVIVWWRRRGRLCRLLYYLCATTEIVRQLVATFVDDSRTTDCMCM